MDQEQSRTSERPDYTLYKLQFYQPVGSAIPGANPFELDPEFHPLRAPRAIPKCVATRHTQRIPRVTEFCYSPVDQVGRIALCIKSLCHISSAFMTILGYVPEGSGWIEPYSKRFPASRALEVFNITRSSFPSILLRSDLPKACPTSGVTQNHDDLQRPHLRLAQTRNDPC